MSAPTKMIVLLGDFHMKPSKEARSVQFRKEILEEDMIRVYKILMVKRMSLRI